MTIALWVLGALAAGVIADEFLGWVTPLCRVVLRRGAQRLPARWRDRYAEEWVAELEALPQAPITRILWTVRTWLAVHSLGATLAAGELTDGSDLSIDSQTVLRVAPQLPRAGRPTVLRATLGLELRRLREARELSRDQAGEVIHTAPEEISHLERGWTGLEEDAIAALLTLYGMTDADEREAFLDLARQANSSGWWHRYGDMLPAGFETYLSLEQNAEILRIYESQFVPALLQTADYSRALIRLGAGLVPRNEIDRRVELGLRRQEVLDGSDPPRIWTVIDEAALRRPIGGLTVMRAQIGQLIIAAAQPNITIQVMPMEGGGAHSSVGGPFTILRFQRAGLPSIVYLEQLTSALYLDEAQDIDLYSAALDSLSVLAPEPRRTQEQLRRILNDYD